MAVPRPIYIVAENHSLAQPLIDALELKRSRELEKLHVFSNESTLLMESRGGAMAAAAAVGFFLGKLGFTPQTLLLHVGRSEAIDAAGAALAGRLVLVNRVGARGRCYYPDVLVAHELDEAGVYTLPVGGAAQEAAGLRGWPLVDAELAGVLAAALTFLAPHQLCCLSAVAGRRDAATTPAKVTAPAAADLAAPGRRGDSPETGERGEGTILAAAAPAVVRLIAAHGALLRPAGAGLGEELRGELEGVGAALRLTATQSAQLRRLAEAAAVQGGDVAGIIAGWKGATAVRSKQERNRRFDELKRGFEI